MRIGILQIVLLNGGIKENEKKSGLVTALFVLEFVFDFVVKSRVLVIIARFFTSF